MNTTRFICLVGVDGTGKSTLARMLRQELAARGIKTRIVNLRMNYMLARPVLLYCRLVGLTRRPIVNGKKISIHELQNAPIVAMLVQYLHSIDTAIAFFLKAYLPMRLRGETVVCDRFVHDVLIDFVVESGNSDLHNRLIRRLLFSLIPSDSRLFLIRADRNVIIERRPDVLPMDPHFDARLAEYMTLNSKYGLRVIENNGDPANALSAILRGLPEEFHER